MYALDKFLDIHLEFFLSMFCQRDETETLPDPVFSWFRLISEAP
jgi:hypothetical protein